MEKRNQDEPIEPVKLNVVRRSRNPADTERRMEDYRAADTKWEFENPELVRLQAKFGYLVQQLSFYSDSLSPEEQKPFSDFYERVWPSIGKDVRKLRDEAPNDNPIGGRMADVKAIKPYKDVIEDLYAKMFTLRARMGFVDEEI